MRPFRFTAIITNYNYGRFVRSAIDSVLSQTHRVDEIIIVDDGSWDCSHAILDQAKIDLRDRIVVIHQKNAGQAAAINAAFSRSTGEIIGMLDADDLWHSNKVAEVMSIFGSNAQIGMIQHPLQRVNEQGYSLSTETSKPLPSGDLFPMLVQTGGANLFEPTSGLVLRREVLQTIIPIPEQDWRLCADGAMAYAAAVLSNIYSLNKVIGDYRIHGHNGYVARRLPREDLYRDLEMTVRYINEWAEKSGRAGRVDLMDQLFYRRDRFYEEGGGLRAFREITEIILRWPLYNWSEKLYFLSRFVPKAASKMVMHRVKGIS